MQQEFSQSILNRRVLVEVDDRERVAGVLTALRTRAEVCIVVRRLRIGDYVVDHRLVVERKTLADFTSSLVSGRLFSQAYRLARGHSTAGGSCMILEGTPDALPPGLSRGSFQGALITLSMVFGLPVFRSTDVDETATLLVVAGRQLARRQYAPPERFGFRPKSLRKQQLLMLQTVPEVGSERAQALLERFETPAAIATASSEQLRQVEGIGERTAHQLRRLFHAKSD